MSNIYFNKCIGKSNYHLYTKYYELFNDEIMNLYEKSNCNVRLIQNKENNYLIEGINEIRIHDSFDFLKHFEIVKKNLREVKKENGIMIIELILKNKKFQLKSTYKLIIMESINININILNVII